MNSTCGFCGGEVEHIGSLGTMHHWRCCECGALMPGNPAYDLDEWEDPDDYLPGPDDLSDDAEALASAGWGTDEDYGYYGEEY